MAEAGQVDCLAGLLRAMRRRGLSVEQLAERAGMEAHIVRSGALLRCSLHPEEVERLAGALDAGTVTILERGVMPTGEVITILNGKGR